jgi:hypothetical protein
MPAAGVGDNPRQHAPHIGVKTVAGRQARGVLAFEGIRQVQAFALFMGLSIIRLTFAPPSMSVMRRICPRLRIKEMPPPGSVSSRSNDVVYHKVINSLMRRRYRAAGRSFRHPRSLSGMS